MTYKVFQTELDKQALNLTEEVEKYIGELKKHAHTMGVPAPRAHPLVENCVMRVQYPVKDKRPDDFVANYEVIDNRPPPPTLKEVKNQRRAEVMKGMETALEEICTQGRRLYFERLYNDLLMVRPEDRRPEDDVFMREHEQRLKRMEAVTISALKKQVEIDDLTEANIGEWKVGKFA